MLRYFLFTLFFVVQITSWSQQVKIDSLLSVLPHAKDTQRVNVLNHLAQDYQYTDIEKLHYYVKEAHTLAKQLNFPRGVGFSTYLFGIYHYNKSEYDLAKEKFELANEIFKTLGAHRQYSTTVISLANLSLFQAKYSTALFYYKQSLALKKKLNDKDGIAISYIGIGSSYFSQGEYFEALKNFYEALSISEENNNLYLQASALNNIAITLRLQKEFQQALATYEKVLNISESINSKLTRAQCLSNIGLVYTELEKPEMAKEYHLNSLSLFKEIGNTNGVAANLNNLGMVYDNLNEYDKAIEYYEKSLEIHLQSKDKEGIADNYTNLGIVYAEKRNFKRAVELYHKALNITREINAKNEQKNVYELLSTLYAKNNQFSKAYHYQLLQEKLKDSLFSESKIKAIEDLKVKYETEKKEQEIVLKNNEISLLNKTNENERLKIYITAISAFLVIITIIFLLYQQKNKADRNKKLLQKNREIQQAQLEKKQLEKQQLEKEITYQNQKIIDSAIHLSHRNTFLETLSAEIKQIKTQEDKQQKISQLFTIINQNIETEKSRSEFLLYEKQNQQFFKKLEEQFPNLTDNEKQLMAFLRMDLSSKEIASLLNITSKSVDMNRYRLRKKLNLESDNNLTEFIGKI